MAQPSRRFWRFAIASGVLLVVLGVAAVPLWRAAFARAAADGRLDAWANRRPERVRVTWREARSPWPGWVEVEDLRVAGRTPRLTWEITADVASGALALPALLTREVRWTGVRARGVEVRAVRDPATRAPDRAPPAAATLPTIPGFPEPPPPPDPSRPVWSFGFRGVRADEVREVWIDDRRWLGTSSARGGFELRDRTFAEVFSSSVDLAGVRVEAGGREIASDVAGRASFRIHPWRYRGAGVAEVARRFDGRLDLAGTVAPEEVVGYLFHGWEGLELGSNPTRFEAALELARGGFRPGSRARLVTPRQTVRFLGFEAVGSAELTARVRGVLGTSRLTSRLELSGWRLGRPGETELLEGDRLALELTSDDPRADRPPRAADLTLDLGIARAPDLRPLNDLIPPAAGLRFDGGTAEVRGTVRASTADRSGDGDLRIDGRDLALTVRGERFSGDLDVRLRLTQPELAPPAFALGGSTIALRRFAAATSAGGRVAGWWGEIALPRGRLELARPMRMSAEFDAKLADTRPLVALWEARRDLPTWAEKLLTVEGISANGAFDWHDGRFELRDMVVPLAHGEVRATLDLERDSRRGRLLLAWRRLAVGVELEGDQRDLRLIGAREWYLSGASDAADGPEQATDGEVR